MADEHAATETAATDNAATDNAATEHVEPGELTRRFRAFAETTDPEPSKALPVGLIAAAVVAFVVLVAVVWILVAS